MSCFLFHKWGKWEQYEKRIVTYVYKTQEKFDSSEQRQRRICEKCGKMQDEKIYYF